MSGSQSRNYNKITIKNTIKIHHYYDYPQSQNPFTYNVFNIYYLWCFSSCPCSYHCLSLICVLWVEAHRGKGRLSTRDHETCIAVAITKLYDNELDNIDVRVFRSNMKHEAMSEREQK